MGKVLASAMLAAATVAQVAAAILALRLIPLTRTRRSWLLLCGALLFQAERRLYVTLGGSSSSPLDITVSVLISLLFLAGIIDMRSVFTSLQTKDLSDTLNRIDSIVNADLDLESDGVMEAVLSEAAGALWADKAVAILPAQGLLASEYLFGFAPGSTVSRAVFEQLELAAADPLDPLVVELEGDDAGSLVTVGLQLRERRQGALAFLYTPRARKVTPGELDFVQKLAGSVSLALRNAQLLHETRAVADTLQSLALALPSSIPRVEFGSAYRSASRSIRVGGDFCDIFELGPGRVGLVIGDVAGKGLSAAALTSVAKDTVRAYAEAGHPPDEILELTNNILLSVCEPDAFVTSVVGILDTAAGVLTYSNAGHPGPILKRDGMPAELLEARGSLLGAIDGLRFERHDVPLRPGDLLLLFTDGVTEARSAEGFFGEESLLRFVSGLGGAEVRHVPERVVSELVRFTGDDLRDDVAMLAIALGGADAASPGIAGTAS